MRSEFQNWQEKKQALNFWGEACQVATDKLQFPWKDLALLDAKTREDFQGLKWLFGDLYLGTLVLRACTVRHYLRDLSLRTLTY